MKKLRNISFGILIFGSYALQAGLPEIAAPLAMDKINVVKRFTNTNSTFVLKKKKQNFESLDFSPALSAALNSGYITGRIKKEESKVAELLHWDFKVKFKLNNNMNIIFSYN